MSDSQDPQDTGNQPYPLRLPNYRFLHQGRYHPYPTFNRQQGAFTNDSEFGDVPIEIWDAGTQPPPPDEAGPSTDSEHPSGSITQQSEPVTNDPAAPGLENLAIIVDELEGTTSGSSAPRDSVDLVIAFASAMRRRALAHRTST